MSQPNTNLRIGWIGTGVMGRPMCEHLVKAGLDVTVHSRTPSKVKTLLGQGATWANSPECVARNADVLFTIVGYPEDVRNVYFGDDGVLRALQEGSVVVDMTTTDPSLAIEVSQRVGAKRAFALDAPVSGGDVGAQNATLSIMVGGDRDIFDDITPLLQRMGKNITYQGSHGAGQHAKMCNQIVIASTMIGVCESLVYAGRVGLDPTTLLHAIDQGAARCWSLEHLAPRVIAGDFAPGFQVAHFIKDMGIALRECESMGLNLPGLKLAKQLYDRLQRLGYEDSGTHALIHALNEHACASGSSD